MPGQKQSNPQRDNQPDREEIERPGQPRNPNESEPGSEPRRSEPRRDDDEEGRPQR